MNIFVILLMALFMAGYYFMDAPNLRIAGESRDEVMQTAELRSVMSCVLRAHSDAVILDESSSMDQKAVFSTEIPCAEKYEIKTQKLCSDDRKITQNCAPDRADKSVSNYIVTTTDIITESGAGKILELLALDYPHAANFGIISMVDNVPHILSSGGTKREISRAIAKEAAFQDGQLVYITQYTISGRKAPAIAEQIEKIRCAPGEISIFRQSKWSCVPQNPVPICSGDYVWDAMTATCVPDDNNRPLCGSSQTAVMVGDIWECVDPEKKKDCPKGYTAELNYSLMEWECVQNPDAAPESEVKKCDKVYDKIYGGGTATLRGNLVSCNDCETMIVHDDCTAECIPNAAAANRKTCYGGSCQNFYFGFPDTRYIADAKKNLPELAAAAIPLSDGYSRNRKFNCKECPFGIDEVASLPPYVIVCQD